MRVLRTCFLMHGCRAMSKSNCFHKRGHQADCGVFTSLYTLVFGIVQILLSRLPNFHKLWWLSIISYGYTRVNFRWCWKKSIAATEAGVDVDSAQKAWNAMQALGDTAFAHSYSVILIEIQDTFEIPSSREQGDEEGKADWCVDDHLGYAAFGNQSPGNILTGFGFYEAYWLIDFENVCIVVHLPGGLVHIRYSMLDQQKRSFLELVIA